jgi:hypothetical protein
MMMPTWFGKTVPTSKPQAIAARYMSTWYFSNVSRSKEQRLSLVHKNRKNQEWRPPYAISHH